MVQLSRMLLAVLLFGVVLLSSCTLRKPVQQFLDLSVTKQLNVGKTTFQTGTFCNIHHENAAPGKHLKTKNKFVLDISFSAVFRLFEHKYFGNEIAPSFRSAPGWLTTAKIPVYILYKKLRLHL